MHTLLDGRRLALSLTALAVTALSLSPASAAGLTKHDLFQRVQEQVLRYSFFTVFDDVEIQIGDNGHVVLTGRVTGNHKADAIKKRVAALDGVTTVTNAIAVLPRRGSTTSCGTPSPARSTGIPPSGVTPSARIRRSTSWSSADT